MDNAARNPLYAVILAAGEARRFGAPKQLAMLDGESLLARAAAGAAACCGTRRLAVAGAHLAPLQKALTGLGLAFVVNNNWQRGPGGSIAAGIRALPADCAGALVWHVDQALVGAEDLRRLRDAWIEAPASVVTARYSDTTGAPVIFPRRLFAELRALDPARGARHVIAADPHRIEIAMPAAATDIDTPDDLARVQLRLDANRARDSRSVRN